MIRDDRIDILVDLNLHMANRLRVFARKPAPVQFTWIGYPGSTGVETIDYRLTDPYLDPPGLNDAYYSEQSIRLKNSFWSYDPLGVDLKVNGLPALRRQYVTFGCLNNFCKINAKTVQLWSRVLQKVRNSRLILLSPPGNSRKWVQQELAKAGITPDRIQFEDKRPHRNYLELYHQIDIALDTYPYNGHTTSLDALWMGVPVVSFFGQAAVSRAGLSQLSNLGLPALATDSQDKFVAMAVELATDLAALNEMRSSLRPAMEKSPLTDAKQLTQNVESEYRLAWIRWCESSTLA
jgi:predicted O-linked N-acetylglucosamine transferase (SPINDLY family)